MGLMGSVKNIRLREKCAGKQRNASERRNLFSLEKNQNAIPTGFEKGKKIKEARGEERNKHEDRS